MFQWRKFQFFNEQVVRDEDEPAAPHRGLEDVVRDVACASSGRGKLLVGGTGGIVRVVDRAFVIDVYQLYNKSITHIHQLKSADLLVTVGVDSDLGEAVLKIWSFVKLDRHGSPTELKSWPIRAPSSRASSALAAAPLQVTTLAVLENLSQIALGLADGRVLVVRGNDVSRDRSPKLVFLTPPAEVPAPVTGLGWRMFSGAPLLFVVTTSLVTAFYTGHGDHADTLDYQGVGLGNTVMTSDGSIVLGRPEACFFYEAEGRGPCFAFDVDGEKKMLFWFRTFLGVVYQVVRGSKTLDWLYIYDLKNQLVAYNAKFKSPVTHVLSEWGMLLVFTADGEVHQLLERDTQTKLDLLFKNHLYPRAIDLAQAQGMNAANLAEIYRRYGDHLYSKRDYTRAMAQYLHTIGSLEPSYVIRKYLDEQRIHNLTTYLQALHEKRLANEDHTTLLLNCYTKLKDESKLDEFVKQPAHEVAFDVPTAIKVCRQAGYSMHALFLARRFNEHDAFLKIQLEDLSTGNNDGYVQALEYIQTLSFDEAKANMIKYGKTLVERLPELTTQVLMALCTDYTPKAPAGGLSSRLDDDDDDGSPSRRRRRKKRGADGGESTEPLHDVMAGPSGDGLPPPSSGGAPVLDDRAALLGTADVAPGTRTGVSVSHRKSSAAPTIRRADAEDFVHIFVNSSYWLTVFLEYLVSERVSSSPTVYNTLLELYLTDDAKSDVLRDLTEAQIAAVREHKASQAMELLRNPNSQYSVEQALILCKMYDFRPGTLLLLEKLRLFEEIVQFYMEENNYEAILSVCRMHGEKSPNLWIKVLSYFATRADAGPHIISVLDAVDSSNLLPPLLVVQTLATSDVATLECVKDFIQGRLSAQNAMIDDDTATIKSLREETLRMRSEIEELQTSAKIFQLSKCSRCSSALDLPAVHFLCMHSLHQRCLLDSEDECPICAKDNRHVRQYKASLEAKAHDHDLFFGKLEAAPDGFAVVADYLGRGIFNKPVIVGDSRRMRDAGLSDAEMRAMLLQ
ncbi:Vps11 [Thecamonas trahens ATCC 50062]|uniref:Vacuolar protein sorting-associated protein 11 homolog n=1 Tax=Thecamonas trahens ATCC 50062 TaxID=461836 RepID=A0A0L0D3A5_THETB|nr:Vps11 [Thecamonas trahens ATCC 50062]KNC46655.1 Vps11 [Thecamonas trahens ATCC 50062]|eukprot:XP_013760428.1 Vps11 [Thecamonas trahens ATCC 50062]